MKRLALLLLVLLAVFFGGWTWNDGITIDATAHAATTSVVFKPNVNEDPDGGLQGQIHCSGTENTYAVVYMHGPITGSQRYYCMWRGDVYYCWDSIKGAVFHNAYPIAGVTTYEGGLGIWGWWPLDNQSGYGYDATRERCTS